MLPTLLAFGLLAVQIAIPWTVPHFVTQDGPSYLYTAVAAKKLLLQEQPFRLLYRLNPRLVPSWAGTIVLALTSAVAGVDHAEQLMIGFVLCSGFFSISYLIRSLSPNISPFTPLTNALLETWFLWMGFHNFYLGMALVPLAIGFYVRRDGKLTLRPALVLAVGLAILYFVHLIAAAVAVLTLAIIATWLHVVRPTIWTRSADAYDAIRQIGLAFGALTPVVVLCLAYAQNAPGNTPFQSEILKSWREFPKYVFVTAGGIAGEQLYLWPAVLALILIAVLGMRRAEWKTSKGGLAIVCMALFIVYLIVPDSGLGGNEVKIRFAWIVLLMGGVLVGSVARLQLLRTPISIFVAVCLAYNLSATVRSVGAYSKAVEDYLSTLNPIRPGSTIIRVRFPTPDIPERYAYPGTGRDPLFHLDAYVAARLGCVDLSDYQAPSADFPLIFKPKVDHDHQLALLRLEIPNADTSADLEMIRHDLPVPIDYAIVLADGSSPDASAVGKTLASLSSGMREIAQSTAPAFVRLYQRTAAR